MLGPVPRPAQRLAEQHAVVLGDGHHGHLQRRPRGDQRRGHRNSRLALPLAVSQ